MLNKRKQSIFPKEDNIIYDHVLAALHKSDIFHTLDPDLIDELIDKMHVRNYRKGDNIISTGSESKCIFIVIKGEVSVYSEQLEGVVSLLGEGSFFGEIGVLYDIPRTASVFAEKNCVLVYLKKEDLTDLFTRHTRFKEQLQHKAKERFVSLGKDKPFTKSKFDTTFIDFETKIDDSFNSNSFLHRNSDCILPSQMHNVKENGEWRGVGHKSNRLVPAPMQKIRVDEAKQQSYDFLHKLADERSNRRKSRLSVSIF
jgi:CRP-like cAMP-binding protein